MFQKIGVALATFALIALPFAAFAATSYTDPDGNNAALGATGFPSVGGFQGGFECNQTAGTDVANCNAWVQTVHVGDSVTFSGFSVNPVNNGTYTVLQLGTNGAHSFSVNANLSGVATGGVGSVSSDPSANAPAPGAVVPNYAGFVTSGGAQGVVGGIASIIGANFGGLAVIVGLVVGVPLTFWLLEWILGLISVGSGQKVSKKRGSANKKTSEAKAFASTAKVLEHKTDDDIAAIEKETRFLTASRLLHNVGEE